MSRGGFERLRIKKSPSLPPHPTTMVLRSGSSSSSIATSPRSATSSLHSTTRLYAHPPPLRRRNFCTSPSPRKLLATQLNDRAILSLRGAQTYKLLQGLVTNDVRRLEEQQQQPGEEGSRGAFYCGFLNPQGRLIGPTFLYNEATFRRDGGGAEASTSSASTPSVLLDSHTSNLPSLQSFIKRFMLRSRVKLSDESQGWATWAIWSDDGSQADLDMMRGLEKEGRVLRDERTPRMGWRALLPSTTGPPSWLPPQAHHTTPPAYTRHRLTQGVPDGPSELPENASLPLEANLDLMGGVDYKKGCYVGQELTARTHHIGVVRKRVMPVQLTRAQSGGVKGEGGLEKLQGAQVRAPPAASSSSRRAKPAGSILVARPAYADKEEQEAEVAGKMEGGKPLDVPPGARAAVEATAQLSGDSGEAGSELIGLAMLRLQHVVAAEEGGAALTVTLEGEEEGGEATTWNVEAIWPDWWPESIREKVASGGDGADQ